jgi:hypothetical protein
MTDVYVASHVIRSRATKAEMEQRKAALYNLVAEGQPMTVRHAYYRAVVAGIVPKSEAGYAKIQRTLALMRRDGSMPFAWLVDNTRWMRKPNTWTGINQVLNEVAAFYRRDLWADAPTRVEIWCESDSIAGVLYEITDRWDVPLLPVKGFSSLSFASSAASTWNEDGRNVEVIYVGDLDQAGLDIEANLQRDLAEWSNVPVQWRRLAITWEQVEQHELPGTAPKARTAHRFNYPIAVEAEALPAPVLRQLLDAAIREHVDHDHLDRLLVAEESEREILQRLVGEVTA